MRARLMVDPEAPSPYVVVDGKVVGTLTRTPTGIDYRLFEPLSEPDKQAIADDMARLKIHLADTLRAVVRETGAVQIQSAAESAIAEVPGALQRRLHLGCGPDRRADWLNIDFDPSSPPGFSIEASFLNCDLRAGLPLGDAMTELIFSCHFLEHLHYEEAQRLVTDSLRVLKPGGVFRAMLPDFAWLFRHYVSDDRDFYRQWVAHDHFLQGLPSFQKGYGDLLSRAVHERGEHRYIWDRENIGMLLSGTGFTDISEPPLDPRIDNTDPLRVRASFLVQGKKPG